MLTSQFRFKNVYVTCYHQMDESIGRHVWNCSSICTGLEKTSVNLLFVVRTCNFFLKRPVLMLALEMLYIPRLTSQLMFFVNGSETNKACLNEEKEDYTKRGVSGAWDVCDHPE